MLCSTSFKAQHLTFLHQEGKRALSANPQAHIPPPKHRGTNGSEVLDPHPHLSDHLSCTQALTPSTSWHPPAAITDNKHPQSQWQSFSASFVLATADKISSLSGEKEMKTQGAPSISWINHHLLQMISRVTTDICHVSTCCRTEPNYQPFQRTQYSSVYIISSEAFVLNTSFTVRTNVIFQSETN